MKRSWRGLASFASSAPPSTGRSPACIGRVNGKTHVRGADLAVVDTGDEHRSWNGDLFSGVDRLYWLRWFRNPCRLDVKQEGLSPGAMLSQASRECQVVIHSILLDHVDYPCDRQTSVMMLRVESRLLVGVPEWYPIAA